jgi:hypothetical protein
MFRAYRKHWRQPKYIKVFVGNLKATDNIGDMDIHVGYENGP